MVEVVEDMEVVDMVDVVEDMEVVDMVDVMEDMEVVEKVLEVEDIVEVVEDMEVVDMVEVVEDMGVLEVEDMVEVVEDMEVVDVVDVVEDMGVIEKVLEVEDTKGERLRPAAKGPGAAAAPDLTESEPQVQPAAQKPTGATSAPEKPHSSRPDRKKPWSTEKSSVGSGAVLEPSALTEVGTEVQGNRVETPDTTSVQGDGGDVDMVDEPIFKYTFNVTRDIVRSLKALEIEIVELQRLEATGDRGHIEALRSKKANLAMGVTFQ
ncbi:hypothetical protein QTP70_031946 [Hemibagrus guttatus]|uniref:Uncharacterized protein n=1 Tax=Hemibagrus guttatus TaxID=175788 RepID=A0AAE0PUQ2_9TELE|nr:hypothetical protein QTP70_031946 [Hemibagrus guttatus]